jgi:membrane-bound inhibitor of C-type lysozyme
MELQQLNLFTVTQEVSQQGKNEVVFANDMIKVTLKTKKMKYRPGKKSLTKPYRNAGENPLKKLIPI